MKHYINKNKEIFGFESDGSQDDLITKDMKPISLEEIKEMQKPSLEEVETQRIASIKAKAKEVIEEIYPAYKQLNILMSGVSTDIYIMNEYITNIRNISNKAEANKTQLEDISWK